MTKQEVIQWMRSTGYDRRNDMRRYQDIVHDEEIIPEYWNYVEEIEMEIDPIDVVQPEILEAVVLRKGYTSWVRLIRQEMLDTGDDWDNIESCTLTESELLSPFLGNVQEPGKAFTLWTKKAVYFPIWDSEHGQTGVASAPRNPNGIATRHLGHDWWIEGKV